ncbi:MAG: GGDEF domain-containing protein [Halioglobus sp.]
MLEQNIAADTRKRDLVMCVSLILGVFSILGLILRLVTGMYQSNVAILLVLSVAVCSWSFVAVRLGNSTVWSASTLLGFWSIILLLTGESSTGSISPTLMLLAVVPLLATMMINRSAGLIAIALILLSLPMAMGGTTTTLDIGLGPATPENLMLLRILDLGLNTALVGWAIWRYASIPTVMPDLIGQNVTHDFLTGLGNRKAIDRALSNATNKASENSAWLSVILADVDEFRNFNKNFGNHSGDRALVQIASILADNVDQSDHYLGRFGGEEFALILPDVNPREAATQAETIRSAVEDADIIMEDSSVQKVTVTLGVSSIRTDRSINPEELIELATQKLLSGKKAGCNQVQSVHIQDSKPEQLNLSRNRPVNINQPLLATH